MCIYSGVSTKFKMAVLNLKFTTVMELLAEKCLIPKQLPSDMLLGEMLNHIVIYMQLLFMYWYFREINVSDFLSSNTIVFHL